MIENLTDSALLVAQDEQSAFRILYDRYWHPLYNNAMNRMGHDADAQDAVQEVFISCWRNKDSIRVDNSLSPYLFAALKYCVIKRVYRNGKKGIQFPLSIDKLELTSVSSEELLQYKELQSVIATEVEKFPERMREIYQLSRVYNLQCAEIARKLQITEQTVKNTLTSALKRLRTRLSHFACLLPFLF